MGGGEASWDGGEDHKPLRIFSSQPQESSERVGGAVNTAAAVGSLVSQVL